MHGQNPNMGLLSEKCNKIQMIYDSGVIFEDLTKGRYWLIISTFKDSFSKFLKNDVLQNAHIRSTLPNMGMGYHLIWASYTHVR